MTDEIIDIEFDECDCGHVERIDIVKTCNSIKEAHDYLDTL